MRYRMPNCAPARSSRACSTAWRRSSISPGLSLRQPLVREALARGLPVVGDIELFAREAQAPVAAVTGTNGKSTVTTLVAELANAGGRRALAGGNLGEPALDLLERPVPELYVLELSSFQLETTHSLRTVTVDRAQRDARPHGPLRGRLRSTRPPRRASSTAATSPWSTPTTRPCGRCRGPASRCSPSACSRAMPTTRSRPSPAPMIVRRGEPLLPLAAMRLQGLHNAANAMAALAMAEALALPLGAGARGAAAFRRPAASLAVGRRRRRRALRQRLQGHQRRRDARGGRRHGRPAGRHRGRRRQGPGLRRTARRVPRQGAPRRADRTRRRARSSRRSPASARSSAPPTCVPPCGPPTRPRGPATPCCSRRPARASTCSATTPTAATCSPPRSGARRMSASPATRRSTRARPASRAG